MPRSTSLAHDELSDDDFDAASQLAILRRAVAGVVLTGNFSPSELAATRTQLRRFRSLAEVVLALLGEHDLAAEARRINGRMSTQLPTRAVLELVRADLHAMLVRAAEALPVTDLPRTDGALALRALLSDFHASLLSEEDHSAAWALTVAHAELSLLLRQAALMRGPARERAALAALVARARRWQQSGADADQAAELREQVEASAELLDALSQRPEVRRHDERTLRELAALLTRGHHDLELAGHAADRLSALRGLDLELDRLMLDLPLEPLPALSRIARRVRQLRSAALPS
jgi:hypothetical protein